MYVSWTTQTVEVVATMVKEVICEKCQTRYAYSLKRKEFGSGTSLYGVDNAGAQARAVDAAHANLQNALDNAIEMVPCPNCGLYQSAMVEFLKKSHLKWLYLVAGFLFVCGFVVLVRAFMLGNMALVPASVGCFAVAAGVVIFRLWSAAGFDPNTGDPADRIQLGKSLALVRKIGAS